MAERCGFFFHQRSQFPDGFLMIDDSGRVVGRIDDHRLGCRGEQARKDIEVDLEGGRI